MNCKVMVEAMQAKGYWTSPAGKTPHQTLNALILGGRSPRRGRTSFPDIPRPTSKRTWPNWPCSPTWRRLPGRRTLALSRGLFSFGWLSSP